MRGRYPFLSNFTIIDTFHVPNQRFRSPNNATRPPDFPARLSQIRQPSPQMLLPSSLTRHLLGMVASQSMCWQGNSRYRRLLPWSVRSNVASITLSSPYIDIQDVMIQV